MPTMAAAPARVPSVLSTRLANEASGVPPPACPEVGASPSPPLSQTVVPSIRTAMPPRLVVATMPIGFVLITPCPDTTVRVRSFSVIGPPPVHTRVTAPVDGVNVADDPENDGVAGTPSPGWSAPAPAPRGRSSSTWSC